MRLPMTNNKIKQLKQYTVIKVMLMCSLSFSLFLFPKMPDN